jgi:cytochrome c-type biogenesis protein CcmH
MTRPLKGVSLPCSRLRRKAAALDCIKWALGTSGTARFARLTQPVPAGRLRLLSLAVILVLIAVSVSAQEPLVFDDPGLEARYNRLTTELRCLVCQNQNLADSDAPLAHDLREEIYEMMMAGQSNEQIKTFLVDRYGDFVLYRPAMSGNTLALWLFPGALLGIGAITVFFTVRNRNRKLADQMREGTN